MKTIKITALSSGLENEIMAEKVMGWRTERGPSFKDCPLVLIITMDSGFKYETAESAKSFRKRLEETLHGVRTCPNHFAPCKCDLTGLSNPPHLGVEIRPDPRPDPDGVVGALSVESKNSHDLWKPCREPETVTDLLPNRVGTTTEYKRGEFYLSHTVWKDGHEEVEIHRCAPEQLFHSFDESEKGLPPPEQALHTCDKNQFVEVFARFAQIPAGPAQLPPVEQEPSVHAQDHFRSMEE